jgi:hypothetical protein
MPYEINQSVRVRSAKGYTFPCGEMGRVYAVGVGEHAGRYGVNLPVDRQSPEGRSYWVSEAELTAEPSPDDIDFRAMLAREVWSERMWRVHNCITIPRMAVRTEEENGAGGVWEPLREMVERDSGEALA